MKTYKITISGQVQGVGFRPFVYGLATRFSLTGMVSNNQDGVIIYVSGSEDSIQGFYQKLIESPPPVSRIKSSTLTEVDYQYYDSFKIIATKQEGVLNLCLTPDFAICEECQHDMVNPSHNRYQYPFTTCVNCGPRWAITNRFPFEREHTQMNAFEMCPECKKEYENPTDRRFHSQTNSCPNCGVRLELIDALGNTVHTDDYAIFKKTASLLADGKIIAIKNTSGYLLCCNAENRNTMFQLRQKKNRPTKPFAILYPSLVDLKNEVSISDSQQKALTSAERPITIVPLKNYSGNLALNEIAPGLNQIGVMLPYSGVLQLLANELSFPIVATSGNLHGSPIISTHKKAHDQLNKVADYFLQHNLEITHPQDDSVVKFSTKFNTEILFRRSRGYAPNYFDFSLSTSQKIMALGGHLKSSIAFVPNQFLYVSEYLGNLDNFDVYERFTKVATNFTDLFDQKPEVVLVDKHPTYQSTLFGADLAKKFQAELHPIQHHKAHFAAVLGEHHLFEQSQEVLGVVWDGTGYGDDGEIWGGEFFKYHNHKVDRISHFSYFNWLAGNKMAKEPQLSLVSLSSDEMIEVLESKFSAKELAIYRSLNKNNKLKTSSVGRLFDAVASLLDICDTNTYEGEAAILMENQVLDYDLKKCTLYASQLVDGLVPTQEIIHQIFLDQNNGKPTSHIITNFLYTLAYMVFEVAKQHGLKAIAFSGGVFQNTTLVDMITELGSDNYTLYFHKNLSPNDENISFGQIMYHLHVE